MKKLCLVGFLSLAALGLCTAPSSAGLLRCRGCCRNRCSLYLCCKQYNAFDPMCCGCVNLSGCCMPGMGCGMPCGMGCGMGCGMPSGCSPCDSCPSVFSGCCPPASCNSGCCDPGCLPAPGPAMPPPADGQQHQTAIPQPLPPAPQGFMPPMPNGAPAVSYYRYPQAAYAPVQTVGYQNPYYSYAGYANPYAGYAPYANPMMGYNYTAGYQPAYAPPAPVSYGIPSYWYGSRGY